MLWFDKNIGLQIFNWYSAGLKMYNLPIYDFENRRVIKTDNSGSWLLPMPVHDCCQHRVMIVDDAGLWLLQTPGHNDWWLRVNLVCSKLRIWKYFSLISVLHVAPKSWAEQSDGFKTCFNINIATLKKSMLFISVLVNNEYSLYVAPKCRVVMLVATWDL